MQRRKGQKKEGKKLPQEGKNQTGVGKQKKKSDVKRVDKGSGYCPVCGKWVSLNGQQCLEQDRIPERWGWKYKHLIESVERGRDSHHQFSGREIVHWACDDCIKKGLAFLGAPREQTYQDYYPYLAYFNELRICNECGKEYIFEKEEQKHWYEVLKFWVQSRPIYCKACYKKKRSQMPEGAFDLGKECQRILKLGEKKPRQDAWEEIDKALESKYEGVQATAIKVLGMWGDEKSKELLKDRLIKNFQRESGYHIRGVIVMALLERFQEEDIPWILDLYFTVRGTVNKLELIFLIQKISLTPEIERRITTESQSEFVDNRRAAMHAIANMKCDKRKKLLTGFLKDAEPTINSGAKQLLQFVKEGKL